MTVKFNKIGEQKYEIVKDDQVIGVTYKNENSPSWSAETLDGKLTISITPTRKRAVEHLLWMIEQAAAEVEEVELTEEQKKSEETIQVMLDVFRNEKAASFVEVENIKYFATNSPREARAVFADKQVRRNVKKVMKHKIAKRTYYRDSMKHDDLINYWERSEDLYGETCNKLWIIKGGEDNAKHVLNAMGQPWEGVSINSPYDCTGQWFAWEADFVECGDRTFVTQHWGLDV